MTEKIELYTIDKDNIKENTNYIFQATNLYISIFREPPYQEEFTFDEVRQDFLDYITKGCFLLAIIENEVVGFMCSSVGLNHINDSIELKMINEGIDYKKDIYISELGVSKNHRRKNISKMLINQFIKLHPHQNMFLRTGVNNNDHVINLYKKYNFSVTSVREFVINKRANGEEEKDERLYMFRKQNNKNNGYNSGSEYLYGSRFCYDSDENQSGYKSGSEHLYGS